MSPSARANARHGAVVLAATFGATFAAALGAGVADLHSVATLQALALSAAGAGGAAVLSTVAHAAGGLLVPAGPSTKEQLADLQKQLADARAALAGPAPLATGGVVIAPVDTTTPPPPPPPPAT